MTSVNATKGRSGPRWTGWPPGGKCDLKALAAAAGVSRTAFYPKKNRDGTTRPGPYQHLAEEFDRRLRALQETGQIVDPRAGAFLLEGREIPGQRLASAASATGDVVPASESRPRSCWSTRGPSRRNAPHALARSHIRYAFNMWEARSARAWTLDLSILTDAGVTLQRPPRAGERRGAASATLAAERGIPRPAPADAGEIVARIAVERGIALPVPPAAPFHRAPVVPVPREEEPPSLLRRILRLGR